VRQCGILSPLLFSLATDSIVYKIKSANAGCYRSTICCSIFLYADDILLLSPTVTGLQVLLSVCEKELVYLDMRINVKNRLVFGFDPDSAQCRKLEKLDGSTSKWIDNCRYLGVYFASMVAHLDVAMKMRNLIFFRAFNSIFGKVGCTASEEVVICLIRAKIFAYFIICNLGLSIIVS
jgi:Reverse transcriptase (RNA-dependent DNA polymerase)